MRINPFKFQVVEYSDSYPYGVQNSIVAQAPTIKGCLSEYKKHLVRFASIERKNLVKTVLLCDGVQFDILGA